MTDTRREAVELEPKVAASYARPMILNTAMKVVLVDSGIYLLHVFVVFNSTTMLYNTATPPPKIVGIDSSSTRSTTTTRMTISRNVVLEHRLVL